MALRHIVLSIKTRVGGLRQYSSGFKYLDVSVDEDSGVTTATMNRPPVNSLNLELLTELSNLLTDLENNKSRGMILTSSSNKVFCGGLDIMEMCKPDMDRFKAFWTSLQDVWIKLYGSSFPTAAVINGHSPAGGCMLALCCEYRVMLNKFTIGLNETELGISAPVWFLKTMTNTISNRNAELAVTAARRFKTEEALTVGLIDEIAADKAEALKKAAAFIDKFEMIPPIARALTKKYLRGPTIETLQKTREEDLQFYRSLVTQPRVQQGFESYLELLKNKMK